MTVNVRTGSALGIGRTCNLSLRVGGVWSGQRVQWSDYGPSWQLRDVPGVRRSTWPGSPSSQCSFAIKSQVSAPVSLY